MLFLNTEATSLAPPPLLSCKQMEDSGTEFIYIYFEKGTALALKQPYSVIGPTLTLLLTMDPHPFRD